jgi:hypothetical protein
MAGKYMRSIKLIGFLLTLCALLVNACITLLWLQK